MINRVSVNRRASEPSAGGVSRVVAGFDATPANLAHRFSTIRIVEKVDDLLSKIGDIVVNRVGGRFSCRDAHLGQVKRYVGPVNRHIFEGLVHRVKLVQPVPRIR